MDPLKITNLTQTYFSGRVAKIFGATSLAPAQSEGNPSTPPSLGVGDILLVEGSINNGPAPFVSPTDYLSDPLHVGVFGQCIVGRSTSSPTQNAWLVGSNLNLGRYFGTTPKTSVDLIKLTNTNDVLSVTTSNISLTGTLFPTCCIIDTDRYQDRLFYAGGLSNWTTQSVATLIVNPTDGTAKATTNCPEGMTLTAAITVPTSGVILTNGGLNDLLNDSKTSSYFFSPITESWTASSNQLKVARRNHQLIEIDNYRGITSKSILVVGGKSGIFSNMGQTGPDFYPIGNPINKCEVINVTTGVSNQGDIPSGEYVLTGAMSDARYSFGMAKLADGRVLVCGGIGYNPNYPISDSTVAEYDYELKSCEIFDPLTGFWTPVPNMLEAHSYCVCKYVPGTNKVYVYGGYRSTLVEYLDLNDMTWHKSVYSLSTPIVGGSPLGMNNQFLALLGGGTYNFTSNVFSPNENGEDIGTQWNAIRVNVPEYTRYDGLNAEWKIESYDAVGDSFSLSSASLGDYTNTDVRWSNPIQDISTTRFEMARAIASSDTDVIGPFALDTKQSFAISGKNLVLDQTILKGTTLGSISVVSGAFSVGPGYLLFNYGYNTQVGPVRCFGATDDFTVQIDAGFKFPIALAPGDVINVLYQRGELEGTGLSGLFWLTASNAGRSAAIDFITSVSASGIELDIFTRYPGDRGLGGEGLPIVDNYKLSDIVECFGRDDIDAELRKAKAS